MNPQIRRFFRHIMEGYGTCRLLASDNLERLSFIKNTNLIFNVKTLPNADPCYKIYTLLWSDGIWINDSYPPAKTITGNI